MTCYDWNLGGLKKHAIAVQCPSKESAASGKGHSANLARYGPALKPRFVVHPVQAQYANIHFEFKAGHPYSYKWPIHGHFDISKSKMQVDEADG